ncbi:MAG: hypothetical protein RLZZ440_600 [Planctomycetota bacterium]|jgi:autotransporter-associated beta strand protein
MTAVRSAPTATIALFLVAGILDGPAPAETVTYITQTSNFNALLTERANNPPYAGSYDENASEMGNYANSGSFGNTPGAAAFRTFTTSGSDKAAAARPLQVGDQFTITAYTDANPSPGGRVGISFRDSMTYSSFFDSTDGATEARIQLDNTGGWKVYGADGGIDSNLGAAADRTLALTITSDNTFNASVGGVTIYNQYFAAEGGAIDSFSIYTFGDSNANSFWKNASLSDTGLVQLGYASTGTFIPGLITDGLAADSTSTVRSNAVAVGGDADSMVRLLENNTYTGTTTVNANATASVQHANGLGTTDAGTFVTNGGAVELFAAPGTPISFAAEPLTLNGLGVNGFFGVRGALRHKGGDTTWTGPITLGSNSRINADVSGSLTISASIAGGANVLFLGANDATMAIEGVIGGTGSTQDGTTTSLFKDGANTLTLEGSNTYSGDTRITAGTLTVASGGNLGDGSSDVFVSAGATLTINTSTSIASLQETGTENGGVVAIGPSAVLTINGADKGIAYQNSVSGDGGLTMAGSGTTTLGLYGTQSYTGTTTVTGGRISTGVSLASASVIVGGGTFETTGANILGDSTTVAISSGTYSLGGDDTIGTFSISGGSLSGAGTLTALSYTITGGTISANLGTGTYAISGTPTISGTIAATSMTVASGSVLDLASSGDYSTAISGDGGVSKTGSSTLTLSGNNSYAGPTSIDAGTLLFNGTNTGNGAVTVAPAAAIGGTGSIAGDLTLGTDSSFYFNASGGLTVGGTVSFTTPANFGVDDIIGLTSATPPGLYTLFDGNVTTTGLANLGSSNAYDLGNGTTAYFVPGSLKIQVVPEPGSMLITTAGLAATAGLIRRRSRR